MRRHPRPLPGLQPVTVPVAGFRSPAGGPLSVLPPPPPSAWRFFLLASRERRQQSADFNSSPPPPASVLRTRILLWPLAALRLPPAKYSPLPPVAAFAFSALRLRLRFGSPCGGRRRAAGSASGRHHARATVLFLPIRRHHPPRFRFLFGPDHASSSPPAGYCPGRASVRLACVYDGSGAAAFLAATCPGFASARRHPRPGERSSWRSGGSQPLLAALTTLSVCLGFSPTTQAGTRQPFGAASLSASTAPAHAAPLRITPRC